MRKINKQFSNKKKLLVAPLCVLILLGTGYVFYQHKNNNTANSNTAGEDKINYEPPTKEDAQRASDNKQRIVEEETKPAQNNGSKKLITPTITYASEQGEKIEAGGFVSNIFEDGGVCTFTFTKGTASFSKHSTGISNAQSVACPAITVGNGEFSEKGQWSVTLSYSSATASGTSAPKTLAVN